MFTTLTLSLSIVSQLVNSVDRSIVIIIQVLFHFILFYIYFVISRNHQHYFINYNHKVSTIVVPCHPSIQQTKHILVIFIVKATSYVLPCCVSCSKVVTSFKTKTVHKKKCEHFPILESNQV